MLGGLEIRCWLLLDLIQLHVFSRRSVRDLNKMVLCSQEINHFLHISVKVSDFIKQEITGTSQVDVALSWPRMVSSVLTSPEVIP